ncbi:MAG TPA: hypothetical protein VN495_01720, partial [Candidatus Paceibacterota bacterium]|nr:hypothetical protein [Candidatus Paceibacterota bacterium]
DQKKTPIADSLAVILEISEKDGRPWIDLEKTWDPARRVGALSSSQIAAKIKGRTFCYRRHNLDRMPEGSFLVPDGDLLCRYLYGTATAAEVLHAAVQKGLEPTLAARVESLTRDNRRQESLIFAYRERIDLLEEERDLLRGNIPLLERCQTIMAYLRQSDPLYSLLKRLPRSSTPRFLRGYLGAMYEMHSTTK